MKGRKPKPAEIKRKTGNPGKRPLGDPVLVGRRLTTDDGDDFHDPALVEVDEIEPGTAVVVPTTAVPAWMPPLPHTLALTDELDNDDQAQRLWKQVCTILIDANIITEGDLFAVEQFVMATLEARRAYFELRTAGSTVATANPAGGRAALTTHPAYRVWRDSNATMLKWGEHLALTPVARTRLGLAIGHGRKLAQELDDGLPENPVRREGIADVDATATDLDPYGR